MARKVYEFPSPPDDVELAMLEVIDYLRRIAEDQPTKVKMMMWGTVSLLEGITCTGPFHSEEEADK